MKHDQKNEGKRPKLRIKKGDHVVVTVGKDRGKTGRVLEVYPSDLRVLVEGVNVAKRSYRKGANPNLPQGGIHEKETPIHVSNVAIVDPKTGKATRVGIRQQQDKDGKVERVRVTKASDTILS